MPNLGNAVEWIVKRISALTRTATDADLTDSEYMAVDKSDGYTRKMTVASFARWVLGRIRYLTTTATEADIISSNYIPLDGSTGPKKLSAKYLAMPKENSFAIVRNYKLTRDGRTRNGNWSIIDYIPVNPGDVVECSPGATDSVAVRLYDSGKTAIDYYSFSVDVVRTFTIQSAVAYISMPIKDSAVASAYIKVNGQFIFDGSRNGSWDNRDISEKVHGRNVYFVGKGTTYSSIDWYNMFVPGNRYKIYLHNYSYDDVTEDTNLYKFGIAAFDSNNSQIGAELVKVFEGSTLEKSYEFTVPQGMAYLRIGGRIEEGETVIIEVVDVTFTVENFSTVISELENIIAEGSFYRKLEIPLSLIQSTVSSGYPAYDSSTTRVCSEDMVMWPTPNGRYKVHAPGNIQFSTSLFLANGNLYGNTSWTGNGGIFAENYNSAYAFRPSFRKSDNTPITVEEVKNAISNGTLWVEVLGDENINYQSSNQINAAISIRKKLVDSQPWFKYLPTFIHISDIHGDITRLANAKKVAGLVGADALINTGDSVIYEAKNGCKFIKEYGTSALPQLFCVGNHESYPTGQNDIFAKVVQPLVEINGYEKTTGVAADNCYYFRDFSEKKIRFIALNYYNNGIYGGSLGQNQLDWFVSTLASTPQDYGVVILVHSPEDKVVCPAEYSKFRQSVRVVTYQEDGFYVGDRPIRNIIDGFISKTSGTESYIEYGVSVSVNYDFTLLNSGVEFICYMAGHRHEDWIGYYNGSENMQLCLGITTGSAINSENTYYAFANQSDLGRNNGLGASQDALNVYAIDRDAGTIKIVRVGADITTSLEKRDYMEIPYKTIV